MSFAISFAVIRGKSAVVLITLNCHFGKGYGGYTLFVDGIGFGIQW